MDNHRGEPEPADDCQPPAVADGELVRRFVATRDEQAFSELVRRYSGLVLGVCRRTLHDSHDAEEAFQATFFVLAKKAAHVRVGRGLGPWLYGVAYRVSLRAAAKRARRREAALPDHVMMIDRALQNVAECHWRRVLDDELNQLPEKFRSVVVLHYLLGKTNKEVAAELGLSVRAVEGRQRRGKELLKRRLMLRKVSLPLALGAIAATQAAASTQAAAPLIDATIEASLSYVNGNCAACSADAVRLAQSEVLAMTSSVAPISATLVTLLALGAGMALAGGDAPAQGDAALPLAVAVEAAAETSNDGANDALFVQPTEFLTETATPSRSETASQAGVADLFERSEAERRIMSALKDPLREPLEFVETPLSQVAMILSETYDIPILFDVRALDEVATSPDAPVTIDLNNIPLRSALRLMLNQIENVTYVVRDDVLMITTHEVAESTMETHVYNLSELVASATDLTELTAAIIETVQPDTWQESGRGTGTMTTLRGSMLVVHQTQSVHEEIGKFLRQLEVLKGR